MRNRKGPAAGSEKTDHDRHQNKDRVKVDILLPSRTDVADAVQCRNKAGDVKKIQKHKAA